MLALRPIRQEVAFTPCSKQGANMERVICELGSRFYNIMVATWKKGNERQVRIPQSTAIIEEGLTCGY